MKFGKEIQSNQIPGWSHQYLDYKALKKIINSMIKGRPKDAGSLSIGIRPIHPSSNDNAVENVSIEEYRSAFFFKLERELEKINAFYLAKESELKIRIQILIDKKRFLASTNNKQSNEVALDEGFQYLERQLVALQAYVDINATGFRKILKKWDKRSKSNTKELYLARQVDVQPVFNREVLAELSNVVATNLIDLENLRKQSHQDHQDQHADPMSIDSYLETNSDIENIIIKLLKKGNTEALVNLLQNHKGLRLTWESLAYATCQEQIEALINLAQIEWSYIDDINNRTCLHKAAIVGNLTFVLLALDHNVDPSRTDIFGRNSIHYAALNGHNKVLSHLLKLKVINPTTADFDGYTPSLYTIVNGHDECLKLLLSQLSSPAASNLHPLCLAAQYGHQSIVKTLLELCKDDIGPNAEGLFAQHLAARGGHANICRLLAKEGGEKQGGLHIKDKYSAWTPLIHAADGGHLECVEVLLSFGCDSAALDENDNTAVFYAAWNGHMECVDALMKVPKAVDVPLEATIKTPSSEKQGGDLDEIPSLALPPPMMPLRIYGHNYLLKRSLIKVVLPPTPIKLSENGDEFRWSSLKLIVMQKPDMLNAPHHLIIPSQKQDGERTHTEFAFQMEDEQTLSLEFAIYPGFGSVVMGKAVALPQVLMQSKEKQHTLPIIDSRLSTIGRITFDTFLIKPYAGLQEQSANVNAYWKSTTSVSTANTHKQSSGKRDSPTLTPNDGQGDVGSATVITSSSLPSEFVRVTVHSSKDGRALVGADGESGLPFRGLEKVRGVQVNDFMFEDLCSLARENEVDAKALGIDAKLTSLESLLKTLPKNVHILLDIRKGTVGNVNTFVDDILNLSYATASSSTLNIAFVTSDTDIAVCLQWKQPHFPVFLGLTNKGSVKEAVKFIRANNLLGLFVDGDLVLRVPKLVDAVKESGSMIVADVLDRVDAGFEGVDGVANKKTFNCLTTFTAPCSNLI